LIAGWRNR